jgi:hypothetical protein
MCIPNNSGKYKTVFMGVRMLNRYLCEYSGDALRVITMNDLKGKKIVIDVSIFLYQFKGNNTLLVSFYKMISLFRDYHIVPIFVFDGVPPDEKMDILEERDISKKDAKERCDTIEQQLNSPTEIHQVDREQLEKLLNVERKKCLHITNANIRDVKALMNVMGVSFLEATGEADELCVYLVKNKFAWACMSEDMDMFVYGCQRVLRGFNLEKGTATLYTMTDILNNLKMTQQEFREVCLLAGTDYNRSRFTIFTTMGYFYKYLKKRRLNSTLYDWLIYMKLISYDDKHQLAISYKLFTPESYKGISIPQFTNKKMMKCELGDYLEKHHINYLLNV